MSLAFVLRVAVSILLESGSLLLPQANASTVMISQRVPNPSEPSPILANQRQQYQTQGVIFETPQGFSPLQPLGGKTVGVLFPAAATAQMRHVSVRLLEIQPSTLGISTLGSRELSEYVRFSFWGLTTPPQSRQTRRLIGQNVTGEVLMQPKNGGMSYLEFYLVPLTQERQLAIAFETDTELPVAILEQTIQTVCATLREDPAFLKKKPRRSPANSLN
jgi:hypothetical protein